MGMTPHQLNLVRCLAENRLQDAKQAAIACCTEDTTRKNAAYVKRYKNMLETGTDKVYELPNHLKGMVIAEDVSGFRTDRYYLTFREKALLEQIRKVNRASLRLMEIGIPYLNSTLLYGESGTGKTMFGRYAAHTMGLPFLYVNFSYLIDSLMGNTSKNLRKVFEWAKTNQCLLMLDEIDAIARQRTKSTEGAERELSNTTVTLLQELDGIHNDTVLIGATNIPDTLDRAVIRRFAIKHEVKMLTEAEITECVMQYLGSTGIRIRGNGTGFAKNMLGKPQSEIINAVINLIADALIRESDEIEII